MNLLNLFVQENFVPNGVSPFGRNRRRVCNRQNGGRSSGCAIGVPAAIVRDQNRPSEVAFPREQPKNGERDVQRCVCKVCAGDIGNKPLPDRFPVSQLET